MGEGYCGADSSQTSLTSGWPSRTHLIPDLASVEEGTLSFSSYSLLGCYIYFYLPCIIIYIMVLRAGYLHALLLLFTGLYWIHMKAYIGACISVKGCNCNLYQVFLPESFAYLFSCIFQCILVYSPFGKHLLCI